MSSARRRLPFSPFRDLGVDDSLCQSFDDRRLAHAGLPDQHRVVLGPSLQHLDGPAYFVIASYDRIELALFCPLGEIDGELLKRPAVLFRVRIGHGFAAADRIDRLDDRAFRRAVANQEFGDASTCLDTGKHEQLTRYELVLSALRELVAEVEVAPEVVRYLNVAGGAIDPGQRIERNTELRAQRIHIHACQRQEVADRGALLVEQRRHHMHRFDELVVVAERKALCVRERHLELGRELFHSQFDAPLRSLAGEWADTHFVVVGKMWPCGAESSKPCRVLRRTGIVRSASGLQDPREGSEPPCGAVAAVREKPALVPIRAEFAAVDTLDPQRFKLDCRDLIQIRQPSTRSRRRRDERRVRTRSTGRKRVADLRANLVALGPDRRAEPREQLMDRALHRSDAVRDYASGESTPPGMRNADPSPGRIAKHDR